MGEMQDRVSRFQETERQFRTLFDNRDDDIWILDVATLKFIYASTIGESIDGRTPEETIGLPLQEMVSRAFMKQALERLQFEIGQLKEGKHQTVSMDAELMAKDGSLIKTSVDMRLFDDCGNLRVLGITRNPETRGEIKKVESELEAQLQEVLQERDRLRWEIKILQGFLPICSNCRKIRDEKGDWLSLEEYVLTHSEAEFTHTICPPCKDKLYPYLKDGDTKKEA